MWLLYASASALCFGFRGILYQWTSRKPIDRNLLLLGVYLCGMLVAFCADGLLGQPWTKGALFGVVMGVFSFAGNASMYKGFAVAKASLVAIIIALPPVVVAMGAYLIWNEKLSGGQMASFLLILGGILLIRYSSDISLSNLQGAQWAILAMVTFGLTDLSSKASVRFHAETMPTLALMYGTGSMLFLTVWLLGLARKKAYGRHRVTRHLTDPDAPGPETVPSGDAESAASASGRSWPAAKTLGCGMAVGLTNISGMMLILPAFRLGVTGLVSAVIALNVILILIYARAVLKEAFSRLELTGMAFALIGILVLRMAG